MITIRLIYAEPVMEIFKKWLHDCSFCPPDDNTEGAAIYTCLCQLEEAPTVEAVPVIRCLDCFYFKQFGECARSGMVVSVDDFCSFGEKKVKGSEK